MRSSAPDLASVSLVRLHTLQRLNFEKKSELLANLAIASALGTRVATIAKKLRG